MDLFITFQNTPENCSLSLLPVSERSLLPFDMDSVMSGFADYVS